MSKNTYWIADPQGAKALVEGADERDRWVRVHGWTESDEPGPTDQVHVRHEDPAVGPAILPWQAAQDPAWTVRGWAPGAPPEPVNLALSPERLAEEQATQDSSPAESRRKSRTTAAAAAPSNEE